MTEISKLVKGLFNADNSLALQCANRLKDTSLTCSQVYPFFDTFIDMLQSANTYVRIRGIMLLAANAQWDNACKLDTALPLLLNLITDDKPIVARQCIQALPAVVQHKPLLKAKIVNALRHADIKKYKDSMQPLIAKDIQTALTQIEKL
ncbi:MAG: SufBD protein [Oscillospiraceae bacterium]|nr:SufBD protein [Oscillospiraceae bacterium]